MPGCARKCVCVGCWVLPRVEHVDTQRKRAAVFGIVGGRVNRSPHTSCMCALGVSLPCPRSLSAPSRLMMCMCTGKHVCMQCCHIMDAAYGIHVHEACVACISHMVCSGLSQVGAGQQAFSASFSCLAEDVREVVGLFAEVVR